MRTALLLFAIALSGCAPSVVGAIDLTETPRLTTRGTLLVVPVTADEMPRPRLNPTPADYRRGRDSMRVATWVAREDLDGATYQSYAVEAIAQAISDAGDWSEVRVGAFPDGLAMVEETYSIRGFTKTRSRAAELRTGVTGPAAGTVNAFGPDVDYVAFLVDPSLGFAEAQQGTMIGPVGSVGRLGVGVGVMVRGDDSVAIGSDVVVWDNRAGRVVTYGNIEGAAAIRSRMVSSEEQRSAPVLLEGALDNLAERIRQELPALTGGD